MKFSAFLAVTTLLASPLWADDYRTAAPVVAAEIYPQGGFLTRAVELDLPAGAHRILFPYRGKGAALNPKFFVSEGLQVTGISTLAEAITDVTPFLTAGQTALIESQDALMAEETALKVKRTEIGARMEALAARQTYVAAIRPPTDQALDVEQLQAIAAHIEQENTKIAAEKAKAAEDLRVLVEQEEALRERQADLAQQLQRAGMPVAGGSLLVIDVLQSETGPATVQMVEATSDAGWSLSYDAELFRGDRPHVELTRNVALWQETGLPWQSVDLRLEAKSLNNAVSPQEVWPNRAGLYEVHVMSKSERMVVAAPAEAMAQADLGSVDGYTSMPSVEVQGLAVAYVIETPVTIASGDQMALTLDRLNLPARAFVQAAPRFDKSAFLMAEITHEGPGPLMAATASLSRDGQLVGQSGLNQIAPGETFTLGFGAYDGIVLDVNFDRNDTGDTGIIRSRQTRTQQVTFSVQNLTAEAQEVRTLYALPFSEQEDLVVDTSMSQRADEMDVDGKRNVAAWNLTLAPGEKREITLDMSLSWPEGKMLDWEP